MTIDVKNCKWEDEIGKIQNESIDLIYTDPPYEMNYKSNIAGNKKWNKHGKPRQGIVSTMDNDILGAVNWSLLLSECFRILKNNKYMVLHCNTEFLMRQGNIFCNSKFNYKGTIIWNKRFSVGGDLGGAMKRDWEPIVYMAKGKPKLNSIKVMRNEVLKKRERISEIQDWVFSLKKAEKIGHPTQKPILLAKQMIDLMTLKNDCILDPFAGSGTIALACQETSRSNISYESNQKFYELIQQRLSKASSIK
jgi:site-specific DNA-methyltransferase (adenine-specific)